MNTELALTKVETPAEPPPELSIVKQDAKEHRVVEVNEALMPAYQKASTLQLTEGERTQLMEPFPDEAVEVRPHDGLLYIPHIEISDRLCRVFGPGQWCTVRRREWIEGNRIYAEWVLLIRGIFVGESVGAMDYHPNNPKMNYSDALEGTRGECIRRIAAKELGCGSQVWRPSYTRGWNERNPRTGKPKWGAPTKVAPTPRSATNKAAVAPDPAQDAGDHKTLLEALYKLVPQTMRGDVNTFLQGFDYNGKHFAFLLPNETLADLPVDKLKQIVNNWDKFKGLIEKWIQDRDMPEGAEVPVNEPEGEPTEEELEFKIERDPNEPAGWREMVVPFGKDAGKLFGDLPKNTLWWWAVQWEPKPYRGEIKATDTALRAKLDDVRKYYNFTDAKEK